MAPSTTQRYTPRPERSGALGAINGDHYQDIVISAAGEDLNGVADTGAVTVRYGSESGLDTRCGAQYFAQSTAGVPGDGSWENSGNGAVTYLPSSGTKITTTGARSVSPSPTARHLLLGLSGSGAGMSGDRFWLEYSRVPAGGQCPRASPIARGEDRSAEAPRCLSPRRRPPPPAARTPQSGIGQVPRPGRPPLPRLSRAGSSTDFCSSSWQLARRSRSSGTARWR
ncbi:FG-GAP repeat protein [Streptomyces sp. NPDC059679]|uniref:FG-GAP repeat protein n=1 Tax=Streptomyces sp. NPDC059679 TaxID=3346903 RepID=UPI0036CA03A6